MGKSLAANARYIEEVDKTVNNHKKYVKNRDNSLEEVRRVYVYLKGSTNGFSTLEKELREEQADKLKYNNQKQPEWHFDREYLWNKLNSDKYFIKAIETRRIRDYADLVYMTSIADTGGGKVIIQKF